MREIVLAVMLFAAAPAAADPFSTPSVDERLAAERKAIEERIYGDTTGVRYTFSAAFLRGLTLGISEVFASHVDGGFPVLAEASKINPRTSLVGTILGFLLFVGFAVIFVYPPDLRALWRRRLARKAAADRLNERERIVGSFVTRDGYEFVVTRSPLTRTGRRRSGRTSDQYELVVTPSPTNPYN